MFNYPVYTLSNVQNQVKSAHLCTHASTLYDNYFKIYSSSLKCTVDNSVELPFQALTHWDFLLSLKCRIDI